MIDIKWIIENPELFDKAMEIRKWDVKADKLIELNNKRKENISSLQELQSQRNAISKEIGLLKSQNKNTDDLLKKAEIISKKMEDLKALEDNKEADELYQLLIRLPNILQEDVPIGFDDNDNKVIRKWGEPTKFDFEPKPHYELGEALGMMDFEQTALISGARSTTLLDDLAKLERALSNFALDRATKYGFIESSMPPLVRDNAMFGGGVLPKFAEDAFKTTNGMWLIPTSEIPLVNWVADKIVSEEELPIRLTAYTSCFRSEAGSAGKDTRGMLRQFHFKKVEMVAITTPENSKEEHERIAQIESEIFRDLGLPYQVLLLCSGDTGHQSSRTYDHEIWLPGQNKYRELTSTSNCLEYQSRRMNSRYRTKDGKVAYTHALNGTCLAIGRAIIAIMENYQQKDGSIKIPEILVPYMGGMEVIKKK